MEAAKTRLCCLCMCRAIREQVAKGFTLQKFENRQLREADLSPAVGDKEIATYLQHVLTVHIAIETTIRIERDRFSEFMGAEGSSRAEHKLVSLYRVFAVLASTRVFFLYISLKTETKSGKPVSASS